MRNWQVAIAGIAVLLLSACSFESRAGSSESGPTYSRDGAWVAFTSDHDGRSDIYVGRADAAAERITDTEHGAGGLAWSPDGSRIVFSALTGEDSPDRAISGLFVVGRDGKGLRQITSGEDDWPCWVSDGETIVFERGSHLRTVRADGTGGRRLVRNAGMPVCSPTASEVAYVVHAGGAFELGFDIAVIDLQDGSRRVLFDPPAATEYASPSWSPDGKQVVFEALRERTSHDPVVEEDPAWAAMSWYFTELYSARADGGSHVQLTRNAVGDRWPVWLPDGRILFLSNREGADDFTNGEESDWYVMNADGTGVERFEWKPTYS